MSYLGRKKGALKRKVKRKIIPGYGRSYSQILKSGKSKRKKQKTAEEKASDRLLAQFIFSIIFVIWGLASFKASVIAALSMIAAGVILCPLIKMQTLYRAVIVTFCIILGIMVYPKSETSTAAESESAYSDGISE